MCNKKARFCSIQMQNTELNMWLHSSVWQSKEEKWGWEMKKKHTQFASYTVQLINFVPVHTARHSNGCFCCEIRRFQWGTRSWLWCANTLATQNRRIFFLFPPLNRHIRLMSRSFCCCYFFHSISTQAIT